MESNFKIKKLFVDENIRPIIQKNKNGSIIFYSSDESSIKYELTYHYFMR